MIQPKALIDTLSEIQVRMKLDPNEMCQNCGWKLYPHKAKDFELREQSRSAGLGGNDF